VTGKSGLKTFVITVLCVIKILISTLNCNQKLLTGVNKAGLNNFACTLIGYILQSK
jgi:hypothetical protein